MAGSGEPPVGHPCHQLSNPSARMFWCRHCMTGFPDPMQRWRHSKECKEISSQKKYGSINASILPMHPLLPKYESPTPSPQSDSSTPNKKKKSVDLKCYICKKEFITINEMRDHVKRPCNKPEVKNPLKDTLDSLISTNEEDSDDSVSQNEDKVTNQIETLLKAAQILQQKKDQLLCNGKQINKTVINDDKCSIENVDIDMVAYSDSDYTKTIVVNGSPSENNKDSVLSRRLSEADEGDKDNKQFGKRKLDDAMKIYDFISDTPEPSPCPPESLPCQPEASVFNHEMSPSQPEKSPCQQESDSSDQNVSTDTLNKTYVSSLQHETSDSTSIPKIRLKLVSGEKPKTEVWGIGASLPKRIRKRKSKDFFDDINPVKVKKKEMTLKEIQDKLLNSKCKEKTVDKVKLKIENKLKIKIDKNETEVLENENTDNNNKSTGETEKSVQSKTKKKVELKVKKELKNGTRNLKTRNGKIVGKKNLVVLLTDCLTRSKANAANNNSKKQGKTTKNAKKIVNGKQKPTLRAKVPEKQKDGKSNPISDRNKKNSSKTTNKANDKKEKVITVSGASASKAKSRNKQKPVAKSETKKTLAQKMKNEKPVKCKACDRSFRTRDLLIKHNQIPCRMRNTRNMTQIILRPKKTVSHTLPLTQRQINAAKRRKQIAGKLSILDNSVKKDAPVEKVEKPEKPKKPRSRKRLASPYFTFCITPKDKSQIFEPLDYESLSDKDQYFFKLGMYSVSLRSKLEEKSEIIETEKTVICSDLKPCEIIIDQSLEVQSVPSFPSVRSEISPPVLEKVSEISKEIEEKTEDTAECNSSSQDCLDPPDLINVLGALNSKPNAFSSNRLKSPPIYEMNKRYSVSSPSSVIPQKEAVINRTQRTPTPEDASSSLLLNFELEDVSSATITNGANSSENTTSINVHEQSLTGLVDMENKENRNDLSVPFQKLKESISPVLQIKKRDVGVSCNDDDILNEFENSLHFGELGFDLKVIQPKHGPPSERTEKDLDISSKSRSSHFVTDVKSGTNRKLTYTVTLGVQTEQSFLKSKKPYVSKFKDIKMKKDKLLNNAEKMNEKPEERNLFHSIADLVGTTKKDSFLQETIFDSLLPQSKVTFDDILEIEDLEKTRNGVEKMTKLYEKSKITEVEIVLPNRSKIAQLCTDIDWLEADVRPVKSSPLRETVNLSDSKISSNVLEKLHGDSVLSKSCSELDISSLEKAIPFSDKQVCNKTKHSSKQISFRQQEVINESGIPEIYVFPEKSDTSEESVMKEDRVIEHCLSKREDQSNLPNVKHEELVNVTNPQPSKVDEDLNLKTSDNLLDLIAKTMGIIPEAAKQKFEKSVLSLLSTATSPLTLNDKSEKADESPVIIMNNSEGSDNVTSDITVIDDRPLKLDTSNRISDHVIKPSNSFDKNEGENSPEKLKSGSFSDFFLFSHSLGIPESFGAKRSLNDIPSVKNCLDPTQLRDNHLLTPSYSPKAKVSNLDNKKDCLANRRRSPRPPNIITNVANSQNQIDVFNHGSKDDTVTVLSDQDSPTIITNFDFEKYAENLREETFFTTQPLSPIRPVSLTPSSDQLLVSDSKPSQMTNYSINKPTSVITGSVNSTTFSLHQPESTKVKKPEAFLKPLAIDCNYGNQNEGEESYICDISPPIEGPTQNMSPVDLAKVATAKMTNSLILKTQGFSSGILQLSNNRPLHSQAFLPQNNSPLFMSPKKFSCVDQPENLSQSGARRHSSQENGLSANAQIPYEGNIKPVQLIDIHLNTYKPDPALSSVSTKQNCQERRHSTGLVPKFENYEKRQNVIVSPSLNQDRSRHNEVSPDLGKQKHLHNINILRNCNKPQDRRQSLPMKGDYSNSNQSPLSVSPMFPIEGQGHNLMISPKSNTLISCNTETQDAILDMIDKSDKVKVPVASRKNDKTFDNYLSNIGSDHSPKFQYPSIHPKKAAHQRHVQRQNIGKELIGSPKTNAEIDHLSRIRDHEHVVVSSRLAEQSQIKSSFGNNSRLSDKPAITKSLSAQDLKVSSGHMSHLKSASNLHFSQGTIPSSPKYRNIRETGSVLEHSHMKNKMENRHKIPHKNVTVDKLNDVTKNFERLPHHDALIFNQRLQTELQSSRSNFANVQRSHSLDRPNVKNNLGYQIVPESRVIGPQPVISSYNYSNVSKTDTPPYSKSVYSLKQNHSQVKLSEGMPGPNLNRAVNNDIISSSQFQRQTSAPSNLGTKPKTIVHVPDYEDVSSPEEIEVYPTTPRAKQIPQKPPPLYGLENETLSIHSADKGHSSRVSIPENFKSSLDPRVQYLGQRSVIDSGNRVFQERQPQQTPNFFHGIPPRLVHKPREVFNSSIPFSEFCPSGDISDTILDNI